MSHELRTPLNAVLGFAQILELEAGTESQLDAVKHILLGGQHLLEMINDLLDLSRIESDRLELSIEPVAVDELILETIGLLQPMAAEGDVTIHLARGPSTVDQYVLADRRRLRQVLLNLLSNAIKYNHRPGRVDIRFEPNEASSTDHRHRRHRHRGTLRRPGSDVQSVRSTRSTDHGDRRERESDLPFRVSW